MGRGDDDFIEADGGWERMHDDGHELAEYMLDTAHPYDLHGYKPADRWGSRQELTPKRFNDPASLLDETGSVRSVDVGGRSSGRTERQPKRSSSSSNTGRARSSQASVSKIEQLLGVGHMKPAKLATRERAAAAGERVGESTEVVLAVVRSPMPKSAIAKALGWPTERVTEVRQSFSRLPVPRARTDDGRATKRTSMASNGKTGSNAIADVERLLGVDLLKPASGRAKELAQAVGAPRSIRSEVVLAVVRSRKPVDEVARVVGWSSERVQQVRHAYRSRAAEGRPKRPSKSQPRRSSVRTSRSPAPPLVAELARSERLLAFATRGVCRSCGSAISLDGRCACGR